VVALVILVSMGTTYLTVRQSMKRGMMPTGSDNPMGQSQKMMAYIMPLFALTGLYWPFGLVLYWVMTNVWTLGQQYVLLRRYPVGAAAAMTGGNMPVGKSPVKPATASGLTGGPAKPKRLSSPPAGAAGSGNGTSNGKPAAGKKVQDAKPTGAAASASANGAASPNGSAADGTAGNETASNGSTSSRSPGKSPASKSAASKSAASKSAASKSPASKSPASQSGAAKGTGSNSNGVSANGGKTSANGAKATRSAASSETPAPAAVTNGHKPAGEEGGMLRRFSRNRPEPEPLAPEEPETKIVRQQPQRQSRSKRSGKR
jgi:YidC/Oxa1 family membrane protein insertase